MTEPWGGGDHVWEGHSFREVTTWSYKSEINRGIKAFLPDASHFGTGSGGRHDNHRRFQVCIWVRRVTLIQTDLNKHDGMALREHLKANKKRWE